jgi:hypothetical protein
MEANFGALPGQPTMAFMHTASETAVHICATPILGMDWRHPKHLNFVAVVTTLDGSALESNLARVAVQCAIERFDLESLLVTDSGEQLVAGARVALECHISMKPCQDSIATQRAIISVPVSEYLFDRHLEVLRLQLAAIERIDKLDLLAFTSQDDSNVTKH